MLDRRLRKFDYQLLIIVLAICVYGLFVISSATRARIPHFLRLFAKQAVSMVSDFLPSW